jgi:hypothetical protein
MGIPDLSMENVVCSICRSNSLCACFSAATYPVRKFEMKLRFQQQLNEVS